MAANMSRRRPARSSRVRVAPGGIRAWRVVVMGDTVLSSEGMAALLRRHARFHVCAAVHGQEQAEIALKSQDADLLLLELSPESVPVIPWIMHLATQFPRTRVLFIARPCERLNAERALRAGACAWFSKNGTIDELSQAMEAALSGPAPRTNRVGPATPDLGALSDRQLHVFSLIAAGHGIGRIAGELGISRKTVETHCEHIKLKLHYRDAVALRQGALNLLGVP